MVPLEVTLILKLMGIITSSTSLKDMSIINRCEQRKRKLQKKLRQIHASMCSKKDSSYPENTVPMNGDKKTSKQTSQVVTNIKYFNVLKENHFR